MFTTCLRRSRFQYQSKTARVRHNLLSITHQWSSKSQSALLPSSMSAPGAHEARQHFYQIPASAVRPHRRRHAREPTTRPSVVPVNDRSGFDTPGIAYTFTPGWSSYTVTTVRNDGTLVATRLPGHRVEPPPPPQPRPPKLSSAAQRAQALLEARPSPDEELLARLTRKRKATSGAASTGPSSKKRFTFRIC